MKTDWQTKKLGDLLSIQNGFAFESNKFSDTNGIPLIRIRDLSNSKETKIKYNGSYDKRYIVKKGDFLIGMDGDFNCYEWKGNAALLNQRVCRLEKFNSSLEPRFLFYGINKFLKEIESKTAYITVKHISSTQILNIDFLFPSIAEQRRIVGVLDGVFEGIKKAEENTQKNLRNGKELFESYLQGVFAKPEKDWDKTKLGEVIKLEYGKPLAKSQRKKNGDFPVYGANGIKDFSDKFYFGKPSIIIGRKGSAGEINLTKGKFWPLDVTYFLTFNDKKYDLKFIYNLLLSLKLQKLARGVKPGINRNDVYSIEVKIPPISEQKKIVAKLDALAEETKKLEGIYRQKLADLAELRKAVLKSAFAGKL